MAANVLEVERLSNSLDAWCHHKALYYLEGDEDPDRPK